MRCPDCDEPITSDAVNIQEGVALCPQCGSLSRLSQLNDSERSLQEILSRPPRGCTIVDLGNAVTATASLRSIGSFLACAAMALFWNGIVSVFVLVALAGLYTNLVGPLPAWFPAPGMNQGKPEMNGEPMGLGMTLFLCVFLIPFVTVGAGIFGAMVMNLLGKVEVVLEQTDSYVGTGIGILQWKRRFDQQQVRAVRYGTTPWQSDGSPNKLIELVADRTIQFGSLLPNERMEWLQAVLRALLLGGGKQCSVLKIAPLPWLQGKV